MRCFSGSRPSKPSRAALILALLAFASLPLWPQAGDNPPRIPRWSGPEPVHFCIDRTMEAYRPEVLSALWAWQRETAQLIMAETRDCFAPRTISFRLAPRIWSLGWTLYPPPLTIEPQAGDVTVNADIDWNRPEIRIQLLPVLIHEVGHALGMGHAFIPDSVMWPNVNNRTALSPLDRWAFRCLYGIECGTPAP